MQFVDHLLTNANRIFSTALEADQAGLVSTDWTIFVDAGGGLRMIAGAERSLDSLAWSDGAPMAWQLTRPNGTVRVEGRSGTKRCRLESESPRRVAQLLLGTCATYATTY
jgi:hypothetical protein